MQHNKTQIQYQPAECLNTRNELFLVPNVSLQSTREPQTIRKYSQSSHIADP